MKLEYGKMNFNNIDFNIVELEKEILRKSKVMIEKENIEVELEETEPIIVLADDFYIDQIITNYVTNAIKYSTKINGVKKMKIKNEIKQNKVRVSVFNTFDGFSEEAMQHIWTRFYKIDESRNRANGGNGIGLSIVKAIMNNYGNDFGTKNVAGGVEFYFEVDLAKEA
jgi:signal transduction histidine kinase